jgi:hypothetical protein
MARMSRFSKTGPGLRASLFPGRQHPAWPGPSRRPESPWLGNTRPLPYSVRKASDLVPSGPRRSDSSMRTPCRAAAPENWRELDCVSPRLSCGTPRPTPLRYTRPGKRPLGPDPRASPRVQSGLRSLDGQPLLASCARCRPSCARSTSHFRRRSSRARSEGHM